MKLKKILSQNAIDMLLLDEQVMDEQRKKDIEQEKKHIENPELSRDYFTAIMARQVLLHIKEKNRVYHDKLYSTIRKKKGNTRINTQRLYQMDVGLDHAIFFTGIYDVVTHPDFSIKITTE